MPATFVSNGFVPFPDVSDAELYGSDIVSIITDFEPESRFRLVVLGATVGEHREAVREFRITDHQSMVREKVRF